ncbi:MAG: hypothetical protein AAFR32_09965 [Pseudomonadota bacterium]
MASLGSLLFGVLIVGAISLGLAFLLDVAARGLSVVKRSITAGLVGGFLPMSLPLAIVLMESSLEDSFLVALVLVIMSLIASLLIGFPAAYFFSRKRQKARDEELDPKVFE